MSDEYEWGEWIDWNGGDNPAPGMIVSVAIRTAWVNPNGNPDFDRSEAWAWYHDGTRDDIIRYRIRKPRSKAMDILRAIVNDPDTQINAPTGPMRELTPA